MDNISPRRHGLLNKNDSATRKRIPPPYGLLAREAPQVAGYCPCPWLFIRHAKSPLLKMLHAFTARHSETRLKRPRRPPPCKGVLSPRRCCAGCWGEMIQMILHSNRPCTLHFQTCHARDAHCYSGSLALMVGLGSCSTEGISCLVLES